MKKKLVGATLAIANIFYKKKRYAVPSGKAMANLGCGLHCLPKWLNVDGSLTALFGSRRFSFINKILHALAGASAFYSFPQYDEIVRKNGLLFFDLRNGVPFPDNSLDIVFTSHTLEHLKEADGMKFISDCYRSLKQGGLLRILVPDLDFGMNMYKEGQVDEMLRSFFYTSESYDFHMHKYNYNFDTLKKRLEQSGFRNIKKHRFKEGDCPDIDFLDLYPEYSLITECRK